MDADGRGLFNATTPGHGDFNAGQRCFVKNKSPEISLSLEGFSFNRLWRRI
jgi:hypothetical protein